MGELIEMRHQPIRIPHSAIDGMIAAIAMDAARLYLVDSDWYQSDSGQQLWLDEDGLYAWLRLTGTDRMVRIPLAPGVDDEHVLIEVAAHVGNRYIDHAMWQRHRCRD